MTRRSAFERQKRSAENERIGEIERAWRGSLPADQAAQFERQVAEARARGPVPPPPDMAPGTRPNPPRPGREPKPADPDRRSRRGR